MSLRAYTDSVDDYNRTHTIEIHKSGYGGSVDYLKNTGSGYASFDYEKIDPKSPTDNPIQKGALEFSLWLQSSALIDEIKTADEQTFWAVHKVDGTQEWIGYIYNDLSTYEEGFDNHPFRITVMAKDFTDLGGKDYLVSGSLPDSREKVIATIAYLLDTVGFDIPIKTHTSWIEENLEASLTDYDYLNEIYHETKALREFGRTGDETDQPITVEDALTQLCNSHGLLLKQANGCYWIDQLTEYEDPLNVQEATYDLTGAQSSLTTGNDLTVDANTSDLKVTIQQDNRDNSGLPGLKRVKNKYAHRTKVTEIGDFAFDLDDSTTTEDQQTQLILSDGNQRIEYTIAAGASRTNDAPSMTGRYVLKAGSYYWDNENYEWTENGGTELVNTFEMTQTTAKPGIFLWQGADAPPNVETDLVPPDADGQLTIKAYNANPAEESNYGGRVRILNPQAEENSTSINYQLTQTGDYSVVNEIQDTWFGDGPVPYSVGALRYGTSDGDLTLDSWQFRGATPYRNFHENRLKEIMDTRRGWRRLLSATLKGLYYPYQILSYDSEYFYFIGGSWDLFTGNWEGELFSLDIQTGSDTFDDIPKFTEGEGSGTSSSSTSSDDGGSGISQSTADARYFRQSQALDELATADIDTALTNLGLKGGNRDLDLNSLDINNNSFVDSSRNVTGGTADFSGALEADTLRTDTGKFLAPTSYQFRNAGDTGFRDVEMAGATINGDVTFPTSGSQKIKYFRELWLRESAWDSGDYINWRVGGNAGSEELFAQWHDDSASTDTTIFTLTKAGSVTLPGSITVQSGADVSGGLFTWKRDTEHEIELGTPGGHTGFVIDRNELGSRSRFDIENVGNATVSDRYFALGFNDQGNQIRFYNDDKIELLNNQQSDTFDNDTWAGNGYRGTSGGDWVVENLRVRHALEVYEFVAKQISSVGGKEILSIANGRIESIDTGANTIDVQDVRGQNATSFKAGDLWIVQVTDINNDLESGGTGSIVRSVRGSVSSASGETLTVSVDAGALSDLEENDLIVAYGSSDSARNAIMYRNVDRSDDNLIMRVQTGVTSFGALTDPDNTRVAFGDLYGSAGTAYADYSSETFGFFAGDNASDKITVDATNGIRFLDGSNKVGAQFNASKLTVGDGFEYDAPSNTLNVAAFTVNEHYLSDGTVYIGNDLSAQAPINNENTIAFGNFNDGSVPFLRITGSGGNSQNKVEFVARDSSAPSVFTIRQGGNDVVDVSGDSAQFFGAFVDNTDMWGGGAATSDPATKSDANVRLDFLNGRIYYDALIVPIYTRTETAALNTVNPANASSVDDDEYRVQVSTSSGSTSYQTNSIDIINANYPHRFGIDNIQVVGMLNTMTVGAGDEGRCRIQIGIDGNTQTNIVHTIDNTGGGSSTTDNNISIDESYDISGYGLTPNTVYEVTVTVLSDARSSDGNQVCACEVNENLIVLGTTD